MSFEGISPIRFGTTSMTTATLGPNDPELGTRCTSGGRQYMLIYNAASVIGIGVGCVLATNATNATCIVSSVTSADMLVGVARDVSIASGYYGWVVTRGVTPVMMHADVSGVTGAVLELAGNGLFAIVSNTTGNKAPTFGKLQSSVASGLSAPAQIYGY